jgi:hypothetical protein
LLENQSEPVNVILAKIKEISFIPQVRSISSFFPHGSELLAPRKKEEYDHGYDIEIEKHYLIK